MLNETYLCFLRGANYYAIENSKVMKILPAVKLSQLPIKEDFIKGVLPVEENIAIIIDIEDIDEEEYYIILKINNCCLGICANEFIGNKVIKDIDWLSQENFEFPFYYEDKELKILHLNLELLKGRQEND